MRVADLNGALQKQVKELIGKEVEYQQKVKSLEEELATLKGLAEESAENVNNDPSEQEREKVVTLRKEKKKAQKVKKRAQQLKLPKTGQNILYKEHNSEEWKPARVVGSWKKNSKYQY